MPLRSNVEPGTSRWATRRAQWRAEFMAAPGQRLRCTLPRRQSWVQAGRQPAREEQGSQPAHSHDDAFRGCHPVHPLWAAPLQPR